MDNNNLNKELYSKELFKVWSEKKGLLPTEEYLIHKYLVNKNAKIIEAGTGGGRIIFEIEKLGFRKLEAFDYVDGMVESCRVQKNKINSKIEFNIADATNLFKYKTAEFDYLIYLQQILCFVSKDLFEQSLQEAHRIGKGHSIYLFSFLNWDSKKYNPLLSKLVNFFRSLRNEKTSKYQLPWLILDRKFNWKLFNSNQPQNLWFKKKYIAKVLNDNGFQIIELKTGGEILGNKNSNNGQLYIVCKQNN